MPSKPSCLRAAAILLLAALSAPLAGCSASGGAAGCLAEGEGFVKEYGYGVSTSPPAATGGAVTAGDWRADGCALEAGLSSAAREAEQGWVVCMAAAGLGRFTGKGEPFEEIERRYKATSGAAVDELQREERLLAMADFECARDSGYFEAVQSERNGEARDGRPQLG
ncbi:hypothetical protein VD659_09625 [Herbiconiux sp. 11R-BC]|uniref:hypothetical protein n=1 Tax=Herbiconiux sp. 11R-BC TaxID=3111637 RepID=UPI003C0E02C9